MSLTHTAPVFDAAAQAVDACSVDHAPARCRPLRAERAHLDTTATLRHAGRRAVRIHYQDIGPADAPAIVLAGGISAHRHALATASHREGGWWQSQAGSFDLTRQRIIGIDWLGADGLLDAPIDTADQADAVATVLDALGITRLHAFVGCSYGGMVGLQVAARHGTRLGHLVAISAAHRPHPFASAWRALQRRAVGLGAVQCDDASGLALARQLAMLSYRTPDEFAQRFSQPPRIVNGRVRCAAEDYLDACARRYLERGNATAHLRLSESIDLHHVDPGTVRIPVTVVGIAEDHLVPASDSSTLARALPDARLRILQSPYGHDAFLKEPAAFADVLAPVLEGAVA